MGAHEPQEALVDRLIREAIERGEFDRLAGKGKPIPGVGDPDGEGWWIRRWVEANRADAAAADVRHID